MPRDVRSARHPVPTQDESQGQRAGRAFAHLFLSGGRRDAATLLVYIYIYFVPFSRTFLKERSVSLEIAPAGFFFIACDGGDGLFSVSAVVLLFSWGVVFYSRCAIRSSTPNFGGFVMWYLRIPACVRSTKVDFQHIRNAFNNLRVGIFYVTFLFLVLCPFPLWPF